MTDTSTSTTITTPEERKRGFQVLFVSLICIGMGKTLMFSILPPLGREMGLSELQVAAIFATNAGAWVFFSPLWGRKSDFWGRRPVMLIGLFGYALSLIALALVTQMGLSKIWPLFLVYPLMVLARLIFGIIGSGTVPAAQAYVIDRTSRQERTSALSRFAGAFGFGSMIGPALGGLLVVFGFLAPIYFVAVMAILSGLLIWFYLPERTGPIRENRIEKISFNMPEIWPFALASAAYGVGMAVGQQVIGYYTIDVLGLSTEQAARHAGLGLTATACMALFVQIFLIPKVRVGPVVMMKIGFALNAVAFGIMMLANHFIIMLIAMGILGIGFGFATPSIATAASLALTPDKQGAGAGMLASLQAVGNIIGALAGLSIYKYSVTGPYVMAFVVSVLFLIYALYSSKIHDPVEQPTIPAKG